MTTEDLLARLTVRSNGTLEHGTGELDERGNQAGPRTVSLPIDAATMEACRLLRANLTPGQVSAAPPPLLVMGVSADPSAAMLVAGLAVALAEEGRWTLLVDADMRQPLLDMLFGVPLAPGLADVLECPNEKIVPSAVAENLWVLPAGQPARSPAELLRLPSMSDVVAELANQFDAIIYHASGEPPYPDAVLLAAHVRSAVLIVRQGRDSAEQVRGARRLLEQASVNVLGFAMVDGREPLRLPRRRVRTHDRPQHSAAAVAEPSGGATFRARSGFNLLAAGVALVALLIGVLTWTPLGDLQTPSAPARGAPASNNSSRALAALPTGVAGLQPAPQQPSLPTPATAGRAAAPSAAAPVVRRLLDERFADNSRGWPDDPAGLSSFLNGSYRLTARRPGQFVALEVPGLEPIGDVSVSGSFHKTGGPPGGGYGFIIRDAGPGPRDGYNQGGRYYVAAAGDTGEFGLWRREQDHWVDLVPWTSDRSVRHGQAENELTLRAVGHQLTFSINGSEVATIQDDALASGKVGLFTGGDLNEVEVQRLIVESPS